jgi:hypothetical protein
MPRFLLSALLLVAASASFAADTGKGTFHFGKIRFEPADAFAYQVAGPDGKPIPIVVMTSFKIDRPAVIASIDTIGGFIDQAGKIENSQFAFIRVVAPDRCGVSAYLNAAQKQIDLANSFPAKMVVPPVAGRVAGDCRTKVPEKMFEDEYDFAFSYDLPLTPIPPPTVLTSGGGEPGAVYTGLVKAIQAADWKSASSHLAEHEVPDKAPKASEMKEYFDGLALNYPKEATITKGLLKGDKANLEIKGTNNEGKKIEGVVAMKKTATGWRVLDQNFFFTE